MKRSPRMVAALKPSPENPRTISDEQLVVLRKSMERFGDLGGIVFNLTTGHLVGGHQRLKELNPQWPIHKRPETDRTGTVARGFIQTPAGRFSYREVRWPLDKERAANLAANKISGEWDNAKLAPLLEQMVKLPDFEVTGFTPQEANLIIEAFQQPEPNRNEDYAPPLPEKPLTRPGQLWKLGPHRLLCADATDPASWERLMVGQKAVLCIVDFPYGVEYNVSSKSMKNEVTGERVPHHAQGGNTRYRGLLLLERR